MTFGRWKVTGNRDYRGHPTGTVFVTGLENNAASRAIRRGDIVLLEETQPGLPPGYEFPKGWLTAEQQQTNEAPRGASIVRERSTAS